MPYEGSKVMPEEPYALIGHVRDCGGPGGQPPGLPGSGLVTLAANPRKPYLTHCGSAAGDDGVLCRKEKNG